MKFLNKLFGRTKKNEELNSVLNEIEGEIFPNGDVDIEDGANEVLSILNNQITKDKATRIFRKSTAVLWMAKPEKRVKETIVRSIEEQFPELFTSDQYSRLYDYILAKAIERTLNDHMPLIKNSAADKIQMETTKDNSNEMFDIWKADGEALGLEESQLNAVAFLMGFFSGLYTNEEEFNSTEPFCEVNPDLEDAYGYINDGALKEILAKAALTLAPEIEFRNLSRFDEPIYSWDTGDQPDFSFEVHSLSNVEELYEDLLDRLAEELDESGYDEKQCYGAGVLIFNMNYQIDIKGTSQIISVLTALPPSYLAYLMNLPKHFRATQKATPGFFKMPIFSKILHSFMGSSGDYDQLMVKVKIWELHNAHFYKPEKGSVTYLENWENTALDMWVIDILQAATMLYAWDKEAEINKLSSSKEYKNYPYINASLTWEEFQNVLWEIMETTYGFTRRVPTFKPTKYDYNAAFYFEAMKLRLISHVPEIDSQLKEWARQQKGL